VTSKRGTTAKSAIGAVRAMLDARDRLRAADGRRTYLVSTASHCHGLATPLSVG